jgi:hypothetical protein
MTSADVSSLFANMRPNGPRPPLPKGTHSNFVEDIYPKGCDDANPDIETCSSEEIAFLSHAIVL